MNIKQAKADIKNSVAAYLARNRFGSYIIPSERQRPVFLMGPPGIGKTAIMEQIAEELKIGLVSYSMTHHTRQSALGLPFITKKNYGGEEYSVSEYTMSEIIASVYETMEAAGISEGILFLDEINCVSETLAPAMLQFLQYKTFGRHKVPDGWIVVTAGNPPEYNSSVREFDIVTWDRLKRIDVEADYKVWKEFALECGVHPAIITYLDIRKDDFYRIESTVDGKSFVTARGWSDMSDIIRIYEQKQFPVNESLVKQYLRNEKIAKDFSAYYDLFRKYQSDYQVEKILLGSADSVITERAKAAKFDERLSLLGLIVDGLVERVRDTELFEGMMTELLECLKLVKYDLNVDSDLAAPIERQIAAKQKQIKTGQRAGNLSRDKKQVLELTLEALGEERSLLAESAPADAAQAFAALKEDYDKRKKQFTKQAVDTKNALSNAFKFCESAFEKGSQEMLVLVTELTVNVYTGKFISSYGCEEYYSNNKELLFYERRKELKTEIEKLEEE